MEIDKQMFKDGYYCMLMGNGNEELASSDRNSIRTLAL